MQILAVAGDPGGGRAIAPVVALLRSRSVRVDLLAYVQSVEVFASNDLRAIEITESVNPCQKITDGNYDLLLTSTSCNAQNWEQVLIAQARDLGLVSLAVLDFWSNYLPRFQQADGRLCFPDKVAVMDQHAAVDMQAVGCPESAIAITGQPALDVLIGQRDKKAGKPQASQRANEADVLCFVSQPLAQVYQDLKADPKYLGYDEWLVFDLLCEVVQGLPSDINILVVPHPRDDSEAWKDRLGSISCATLYTSSEPRRILQSAAWVIGMNSILLVEAAVLGCDVLSFQPGMRHADVLPTNRIGVSRLITDMAELQQVLEQKEVATKVRNSLAEHRDNWQLKAGATERVADLCMSLMTSNE